MFGFGFAEIVVVLIVVLVLFRPEDLPKLLRRAGKISRQMRDMYHGATSTLADIGKEIERPIAEVKKASRVDEWWKDISTDKTD